MSTATRIFETLTGLVKLAVGESLRRVHRANQPQTIARAQRPRTSAKAKLAARLAKARPKGKHSEGRTRPERPAREADLTRVSPAGDGKRAVYLYVTDRPRGRVYPAARSQLSWVSTSHKGVSYRCNREIAALERPERDAALSTEGVIKALNSALAHGYGPGYTPGEIAEMQALERSSK